MDYANMIQEIIDALKADQEPNKYWKSKVIGRLTELQPFCLMFYDTPTFDGGAGSQPYPQMQPDGTIKTITPNRQPITPLSIDDIPPSLREFADPNKLQPPRQPDV